MGCSPRGRKELDTAEVLHRAAALSLLLIYPAGWCRQLHLHLMSTTYTLLRICVKVEDFHFSPRLNSPCTIFKVGGAFITPILQTR